MIPCEVDVFEVRNRQGVDETRKRRDEETQRDDGHQHQCFEEDEFVVASIAVFGCIHGNEHIGCADGKQIQNNGQWSEVVLHCVCVCTIYYIPTQIFSTFFLCLRLLAIRFNSISHCLLSIAYFFCASG